MDLQEDFLTVEDTNNNKHAPLWKQLAGALVGGSLALGLYYGYEFAQPRVAAYLTLPEPEGGRMYDLGAANIADKTMDASQRKRILSRNLRAAGAVQDNSPSNELLNTVDTHEYDIAWPGHDESSLKYAEATADLHVDPTGEDVIGEYVDKWSGSSDDIDNDEGEMIANINNALFDEEVATKEMAMEDNWDSLWGEINEREHDDNMEKSNADDLPDTGFGIGFITAGAVGGAIGARRKKKRN